MKRALAITVGIAFASLLPMGCSDGGGGRDDVEGAYSAVLLEFGPADEEALLEILFDAGTPESLATDAMQSARDIASGRLIISGANPIVLAGTIDDENEFLLTGGGYAFSGTASGSSIWGAYTKPGGASGTFTAIPGLRAPCSFILGVWEQVETPHPFTPESPSSQRALTVRYRLSGGEIFEDILNTAHVGPCYDTESIDESFTTACPDREVTKTVAVAPVDIDISCDDACSVVNLAGVTQVSALTFSDDSFGGDYTADWSVSCDDDAHYECSYTGETTAARTEDWPCPD